MGRKSEFYTAKEKLGLLSFGDPGAGDKVQVTDTYLVTIARKLDYKIKQHPEFKKKLVRAKNIARKIKHRVTPVRTHQTPAQTTAPSIDINSLIPEISLPVWDKPTVSIIIPAWNKVEMSIACLKSIAERLDDRVTYEVILVNNGSTDQTTKLGDIPGIIFVNNPENLGFVGGCNSGIAVAKGKYLVFLNNDAEVTPDWLYELVRTIESDKNIGIVGSKIIYPNGALQEAGGIIFNDGSGLNYGKHDQADAYQYNYVRDVDYCSGASVIISSKLMKKFGGFDTLYQPAYYEDTDLSFKVRKEDLRVVYQPLSVIYHIEGGTAGTKLNTGFKRFQEINREKFLERWKKELSTSHVTPDDYYLGRDRSGDKLALIIEETLPTPDKDSGSVRMIAMIRGLQQLGYKVTFWPNDMKPKSPYVTQMQQMGVEVAYGSIDFMQFARHYASFYDLVIMSRPEICAKYINICKAHFTNAKLVYDTVDLHYVRLARQAEVEKSNAEALLEQSRWFRVLEHGLMERTDATLVVSEKEVEILRGEGVQENILVVSNIHSIKEAAYSVGFEDRKDVVFVGNYAHLPNRDAALWLINDIWPNVYKLDSSAKLHLVGANLPDDLNVKLQKAKNVVVHGFLTDEELANLLTHTRVFVAPLRYGAGVKGKIGQAIEYGIPVVSTAIGAEGMHLSNNKNAFVSDDAKEFAQQTTTLLNNKKTWEAYQKNAKSVITTHFSLDAAKKSLELL